MPTVQVQVRRFSIVSSRPFEEIVGRLTATFGHPDMNAFHSAVAAATTVAALEAVVQGAIGSSGVPDGWAGQSWGRPAYDFTFVTDEGRRALGLRSRNDRSTITLEGRIDLRTTPILEWQWKVVTLPTGGDARRKETTDQAAQVYVVWPRAPEALRSRILGYVWDTTAPAGSVIRSMKTGTVTYVVVRSGAADLGRWLTERRDLRADFERVYGEVPDRPGALSISIDSNDTRSAAESLIGPIVFHAGH